ncbi:MAG TPA: DinB family protein [Eudoraea sp.]|nr:DinB family protein [Eudoraea sp.]
MIHKTTNYHLDQLKELVDQLTDEQLQAPLPVLDGSTIGKHVRHILEFYMCLCNSFAYGELNYDHRQRDRKIEVSVATCLNTIQKIARNLQGYKNDFPIKLTADHSMDDLKREICLGTTYYRELLYNIEHIVHHLAIIKIGIKSLEPAIYLDDSIGVAMSTIRNRKLCVQ